MRLMDYIDKPEYLYQPTHAFKRLIRLVAAEPDSAEVVLRMRIRLRHDRGRALWHKGIYDLRLCETFGGCLIVTNPRSTLSPTLKAEEASMEGRS